MADDYKDDEVITVNMPRKDYKILRDMIERERTYSWIKNYLRSLWVWAFAGGIVVMLTLGDRISGFLQGIK